ncbi:Hypothetical protein AAM4_2306 [Actinomyces succiniciruminis]|uniref:Uncharacterized protein n=1 Tax=Actinomyces succiniciruminis TaxID=1522002 RepID=A0A1L7RRF6_9ACTO|nr:Hypothetical protein AAM4_2306 [Actinomyces succiniciruminis]
MSTTDPDAPRPQGAWHDSPTISKSQHPGVRILPVERAVAWIRAWAELNWPITWETAYATRDKLGWTPAPDDGRFFTTELSTNGQEDGSISQFEGEASGVNIPLSSVIPEGQEHDRTTPTTWEAYNAYVVAVSRIYGQGKNERDVTAPFKLIGRSLMVQR